MGPKPKAQKMSLGSFLADENTGSAWADDVGDLPSGPAYSSSGYEAPLPTGPASSRAPTGPRTDIVYPNQPPYQAYIGNLSYEVSDRDIENLFSQLQVKSIRLIRDTEDNIKGFGYCEFEDVESLKGAVALHGESVRGRAIKIDVSEGKTGGNRSFNNSGRERGDTRFSTIDDSPSDWRRRDPAAPARESAFGGERREYGGDRREGGFGGDRREGGFGGDRREGGFGGDRGGYGGDRREGGFGGGRDTGFERREGGFRDRFNAAPAASESAAPMERKRLDLKPRTAAPEASATSPQEANKPTKPNPFGSAHARDEDAIMARIEEKHRLKEEEKRAAQEAAKKAREAEKPKEAVAGAAAAAPAEGSWRRDGPRPAPAGKSQQFGAFGGERKAAPAAKAAAPAAVPQQKAKVVKPVNVFGVLDADVEAEM
ncbi:hypothetical protein HDU98_003348 [Podochytrium sp. JEL0797]|nr:hypothetical protein HDU98_003348 [Podochytrium sp. JEL0797]